MFSPRVRLERAGLAAFILVGAAMLGGVWDRRSLETRYFDSGLGVPDLARIVRTREGEVYWIGGIRESWSWLERPQWLSPVQGAGLVFSRDLAVLYQARSNRAVAAGLAASSGPAPLSDTTMSVERPNRFVGLPTFCAATDAPAWVVAPLQAGETPPIGLDAVEWVAPIVRLVPVDKAGLLSWTFLSRYAVIPCKGHERPIAAEPKL